MDPCHASWADWIDAEWSDDPPLSVLDLCCGSGLMTLELADRGYVVTGVDASAAMLALARTRLPSSVPLLRAVLPDLPVASPFDAVVSTLDGLNYLPAGDLGATFAAVARILAPGGWLIFDMHGDGARGLMQANPDITGSEAGRSYRLTTQITGDACSTTISVHGDAPFTETHTQYLHDSNAIRDALTRSGFTVTRVVDEYSDEPAGTTTIRATWVARREE